MDTRRPRASHDTQPRARGRHALKSRRFAAELVESAGISGSDLVIEVGAGSGKITEELAARARMVLAIELDSALATRLIARFETRDNVVVAAGDALAVPLPAEPFRVFGNIPFAITTNLLRRLLDDPNASMQRADLIVQVGAAIKRTRVQPSRMLNLSWGPWWEFRIARRIPSTCFEPRPSVEAALLTISKRKIPLLPTRDRAAFASFLKQGFSKDTHAGDKDLDRWLDLFRTSK